MTPGVFVGGQASSVAIADLAAQIEHAGIVAISVETAVAPPGLVGLAVPTRSPVVLDLSHPDTVVRIGAAMRCAHAVVHGQAPARELLRLGIEPKAFYDTELALRLLDAGATEGDAAFALAAPVGREPAKGMLVSRAHPNLARSAAAVLALAEALDPELHDASLASVFLLECELLPVLLKMQARGVPIDRTGWDVYLQSQRSVANLLRTSLLRGLGVRGLEEPSSVLAAVRARVGFVANTKKVTLMAHIADPHIADLIEYRRANAFLKSPGEAVLRAIATSSDGRVRPELRQIGAPTGRMACANPNLMALPKDPAVRACVAPGKGRSLVVADYAGIELRVLADLLAEPRLCKLFHAEGDPHQVTAGLIFGKPANAVTELERQKAKAINFGVVFGMGAPTLVEYARGVYRTSLALSEATAFRDAFLEHYQGVRDWHDVTKRSRPPVVRTASGRMRYVGDDPNAFCARLNTPVQGTAADGLKRAMVLLAPRLEPFGAGMVLSIHDELLVDTPTACAQEVRKVTIEAMREGMQEFVQTVPIVVKSEVRDSWGKGES